MRESTNYPGDYTLCVSCDGKVEHYRIMYHASKLSIDEEVYFENLMQLVEGGNYNTELMTAKQNNNWLHAPGLTQCVNRIVFPYF